MDLGIIKLDDEWSIRLMGDSRSMFGKAAKTGLPAVVTEREAEGLPFALVLDRMKSPVFTEASSDRQHLLTEPPKPETEGGLVLQK